MGTFKKIVGEIIIEVTIELAIKHFINNHNQKELSVATQHQIILNVKHACDLVIKAQTVLKIENVAYAHVSVIQKSSVGKTKIKWLILFLDPN